MIGATVYGAGFALLGGYVSAWIAGRRPVAHAAAMALLLAVIASASLLMTIGRGAIWSQLSAVVLMAPATLAGGFLRQRMADRAESAAAIGSR